jgi:predicted porin
MQIISTHQPTDIINGVAMYVLKGMTQIFNSLKGILRYEGFIKAKFQNTLTI